MARQVAIAAINALRDNHYTLNGVSGLYERSVLMEGSRTNTMFPSNDFTSASFTKTGATITASATTGPDGVASSASKIVEDGTLGGHGVQKSGGWTATASTVQSASVYARAGERTWMVVSTTDGAAASAASYVNLATGVAGTVNGAHTLRIASLANGWYHVSVSFNSNVGGGACRAFFGASPTDVGSPYTGDSASGIYVYGYQIEADQPFSTSHIPTVGSTVTRGADVFSVPFTTPPQAMTIYTKFKDLGSIATANARLFQIGESGNTNSLRLIGTGSNMSFVYDDGAANVASNSPGATGAIGDIVEAVCIWYSDGSVQLLTTFNGAAQNTGTRSATKALPAFFGATGVAPKLYLASNQGGSGGFAAFLVPYKVALGVKTLAEMRAL